MSLTKLYDNDLTLKMVFCFYLCLFLGGLRVDLEVEKRERND